MDRAVLVGAPHRLLEERVVREHMLELERLTETAGGKVVGSLIQRLDTATPQTLIGSGKVIELRHLVAELEADLVIFDDDLKPNQAKNLEQAMDVRVMDRSELILDIFAVRARSREAKLQVELAQLEYLLPRLARMWTHLSRIRGGIGLRGPGETQIETDRRLIGRRISELKKKLKDVAAQRATQRKGRDGQFRAALVGYTNAGKSSVLRGLSGADLLVEDRLFATLDPATRQVDLGSGYTALLTDTVGFIRKLPHHLVASFRSTLEEAREADLILHVIDLSHPDWEAQRDVVNEVLGELDLTDRPQILLFNKVDRITHAEEQIHEIRARSLGETPAVFVSAVEEGGLEPVLEVLRARVRGRHPRVTIELPADSGEVIAAVHREGEVLSLEENGSRLRLTARIPAALLGRLKRDPEVELSEL
ncbi:MAG: GTPase HflX [Gemmatimonadetes bacterium]|nr:GTPase HflX [Gemmatimonadota bacterium]